MGIHVIFVCLIKSNIQFVLSWIFHLHLQKGITIYFCLRRNSLWFFWIFINNFKMKNFLFSVSYSVHRTNNQLMFSWFQLGGCCFIRYLNFFSIQGYVYFFNTR